MGHNKILSSNKAAISFLSDKFGATVCSAQYPESLVNLAGKKWWVVTSSAEIEFDLCLGIKCDKLAVIKMLKNLNAGLLVMRQVEKNIVSLFI